jgi:hypothetical protein
VYIILDRADQPAICPLAPAQAVMTMMRNTYMSYLIDNVLRTVDFEMLGQLVKRVPARALISPVGLERLPELYDMIRKDFAAQN